MDNAMQFIFSCASAVFSAVVAYCGWWFKKRDGERQALEEIRHREYEAICSGLRAMLRDRIIQLYEECVENLVHGIFRLKWILQTCILHVYQEKGNLLRLPFFEP